MHPRVAGRAAFVFALFGAAQLSWTSVAAASEDRLVAILPLDGAAARLTLAEQKTIDEGLRTIAAEQLGAHGYVVLQNETTLQILADNGVDLERVCEANCALQAAREMKATLFVTGTVIREEPDGLLLFLRLLETRSGRALGTVRFHARTARALLDGVLDLFRRFLREEQDRSEQARSSDEARSAEERRVREKRERVRRVEQQRREADARQKEAELDAMRAAETARAEKASALLPSRIATGAFAAATLVAVGVAVSGYSDAFSAKASLQSQSVPVDMEARRQLVAAGDRGNVVGVASTLAGVASLGLTVFFLSGSF